MSFRVEFVLIVIHRLHPIMELKTMVIKSSYVNNIGT